MNKRIRQLAEQAGIPAIDGVWDYNDRNLLVKDGGEWRTAVPSEIIGTMINSEKGLEKFAELIVRECMNRVRSRQQFAGEDQQNVTQAFDLLVYDLESHFVVEE
jgi:hypothetical protein